MNGERHGFARRFVASLVLALFMSQVSLPVWGTGRAWAATAVDTDVRAPVKTDVGLEETDNTSGGGSGGKPNVLFFIEASAVASFTTKGVMPTVIMRDDQTTRSGWWNHDTADWYKTKDQLGYNFNDINDRMAQATFGIGALPVAFSGKSLNEADWESARSLYGRDVDSTNNWIYKSGATLADNIKNNADRYYFPFLETNPKLGEAYKSEASTAYSKLAKTGTKAGTIEVLSRYTNFAYYNTIKPENAYPYALVFKDPRYWNTPPNETEWKKMTTDDLVPNDSKLYQTKLVLWRLLTEQPKMFKDIRFGLASTFLSLKNRSVAGMGAGLRHINYGGEGTDYASPEYNGIFKTAPYGAGWTHTEQRFDAKGDPVTSGGSTKIYTNGTMFHPATGQSGLHTMRNGATFPLWLNAPLGTHYRTHVYNPTGTFTVGTGSNKKTYTGIWEQSGEWGEPIRNRYRALNRASLLVPITDYDHVWETKSGGNKITQVEKVKMWIDGLADIKGGFYTKTNRVYAGEDAYKNNTARENQFHYYNDPELGVAGSYNLPMAIYPDPTELDPLQKEYWNQKTADGKYMGKVFTWGSANNVSNPDFSWEYGDTKGPRLDRDRKWYIKNRFIWYALKDKWVDYFNYGGFSLAAPTVLNIAGAKYMENRGAGGVDYITLDAYGVPSASYNPGSGEAAGSIIDFFSPPVLDPDFKLASRAIKEEMTFQIEGKVITDADNINAKDMMDPLSFPIICDQNQDNWVILIASGMDLKKQTDNGKEVYAYHTWDAIKNLYDHTDKSRRNTPNDGVQYEPLTGASIAKDKDGKLVLNGFNPVHPNNPIRTLVVGIVADPDSPNFMKDPSIANLKDEVLDNVIDDIKEMRLNLAKMAVAGQGGDPYTVTEDNMNDQIFKPFYADDVASLMSAIQSSLEFVKESSITQPGKGSFTELPPVAGETSDLSSMLTTAYKIREGNQWVGELIRKRILSEDKNGMVNPSGSGSQWPLEEVWRLGDKLIDQRNDPSKTRNIKYWKKTSPSDTAGFVSLGQNDALFNDITGVNTKMERGYTSGIQLNEALYWWLQGYDYSYLIGAKFARTSMLADFGNSGIIYGDYPSAETNNGLPGYKEWAEALKNAVSAGSERLYAQTNDGILHVINPSDGHEDIAILPPPMLLPSRLASLKNSGGAADLKWYDVSGPEESSGFRSVASYTLDGPLQKRRFNLTDGWATLLVGTLGRGGNGLYTLDITYPSAPKFLWYKENIKEGSGYTQVSLKATDDDHNPTLDKSAAAPYRKLGFNSPKPTMGFTGFSSGVQQNFIALSGGTQSVYDRQNNGNEGAALFLINPENGDVIKAFDSSNTVNSKASSGGQSGPAPSMGMMVSEPTLLRSMKPGNEYMAGRVFVADNRGSIFMISFEKQDGNGETVMHESANNWTIQTIASLQKTLIDAKESSADYAIPYGLAAYIASSNQKIWLGGGTSNVLTKRTLGTLPTGLIENAEQLIFGFMAPENNDTTYIRGEHFEPLDPESAASTIGKDGDSTNDAGWYFTLKPGVAGYAGEYVSSKPVLVDGTLYIATFRQQEIDPEKVDPCGFSRNVSGVSRLYALNILNGGAAQWYGKKSKYLEFEDVKIIELRIRSNKNGTYVDAVVDVLDSENNFDEVVGDSGGNEVDGDEYSKVGEWRHVRSSGKSLPPETTLINYWLLK
jgi:Tfp pilus tip-associated adhesin PilY1